MNRLRFGAARLLRPPVGLLSAIRSDARNHLLRRFAPGSYADSAKINAIIQHQFAFYDGHLRRMLAPMASRDAAEFFLFQYDEANRILHGKDLVGVGEREKWEAIEGTFRRALKYIVELMCIRRPSERSRLPFRFVGEEVALALAENALHLAEMSHCVFSVFPEAWTIEIHRNDPASEFELRIHGRFAGFDARFLERVKRDRYGRQDFTGSPQFDIHTDTHARFLNPAFASTFGMGYDQFVAVVWNTIRGSRPAPNGFPTLFIHRDKLLSALCIASRLPRKAVDTALRGFTVSAEHLLADERVAFRPKQQSRAYRRGFFQFPHETGTHLAFSEAMAKECMIHLCNGVCYRHLPTEWRTPATEAALTELSRAAGRWFETVVHQNLLSLGIVGTCCKDSIGTGSARVAIPASIGELDFLGHHPEENALILIEDKMTFTGLEASFWRDDLSQFVEGEKSYAAKFRRKIAWVQENRGTIVAALGLTNVSRVHSARITLYPCIAAEVITDFPCVSLTEIMLDHRAHGRWPYR